MGITFYIGALSISYPDGIPNPLDRFDRVFTESVLPVTKRVKVWLREVDCLDIPGGEMSILDNTYVWQKDDREIRLYRTHLEEKYLMSVLQGDRVMVYTESNGWKKYRKDFRPWFHIHLEKLLLDNQALVLHSASIVVDGHAIAFTAPSGTGKTTQTDLWRKYVNGVQDLNGDRTLLQKTEKGWYACGFPIYGSMLRCEQGAHPIKAIVVIRQGKTDQIRELSPVEKVALLYSQVTVPAIESTAVNRTMDLLEDFIQHTTIVQLNCTMERSAVDVLREYLECQ